MSRKLVAMIRPEKPVSEMSEQEIEALADRVFKAVARSAASPAPTRPPVDQPPDGA
jgi:hypothetical protein